MRATDLGVVYHRIILQVRITTIIHEIDRLIIDAGKLPKDDHLITYGLIKSRLNLEVAWNTLRNETGLDD